MCAQTSCPGPLSAARALPPPTNSPHSPLFSRPRDAFFTAIRHSCSPPRQRNSLALWERVRVRAVGPTSVGCAIDAHLRAVKPRVARSASEELAKVPPAAKDAHVRTSLVPRPAFRGRDTPAANQLAAFPPSLSRPREHFSPQFAIGAHAGAIPLVPRLECPAVPSRAPKRPGRDSDNRQHVRAQSSSDAAIPSPSGRESKRRRSS